MEKCPFCGNSGFKVTSQVDNEGPIITYSFCPICEKQFDKKEKQSQVSLSYEFAHYHDKFYQEILTKYGPEYEDYARKFNISDIWNVWQIFLWKKDERGETALDFSEYNVKRCEQIFLSNPNDADHLLRLFMLKILAGLDYKDLMSNFLISWRNKQIAIDFWTTLLWEEEKIIEKYTENLKNFLIGLMDIDLKRFKEDVSKDECIFNGFSRVIGIADMSRIITPEKELAANFNFDWEIEYLKYYALAKFYYSEGRWFDAFCLFEKLRIYNWRYKVTNNELLEIKDVSHDFKDVIFSCPTLEDIEKNTEESFAKIDFFNVEERDRLQSLLVNLHAKCWIEQDKVQEKEKEIESYLNVYSLFIAIFNELSKSNYDEAFNKWIEWDKSNVKLMGIDIWETTRCLKDLKDGRGDKDKNIQHLFSSNPFLPDFALISDLGMKLREFVVENLKRLYGDEKNASLKGIPMEIKLSIPSKKSDSNLSLLQYLDFPQYALIIRDRKNWNGVFSKYFIFTKEDKLKSSQELTSFIWDVVNPRHIIAHYARPLNDDERKKVKLAVELFSKVYKKWKNEGIKDG